MIDNIPVESTFMSRTIKQLMDMNVISAEDSVLIVCGGEFDKSVLMNLGFYHAHYSNIDSKQLVSEEESEVQDVRNLCFPDSAFDFVVAHAGLHHVDRPHQAVCEMYRVSKKGVLFFEAQDSFVMKLAVRLGLVAEYEMNAILDSGGTRGGVNDTPIPNYVYRWTKREVTKMIRALCPVREPDILFFAEWDFSWQRIARRLSGYPVLILPDKAISFVATLIVRIANLFIRHQGNLFAVCIRKNVARLQPWIIDIDNKGTLVFSDPKSK